MHGKSLKEGNVCVIDYMAGLERNGAPSGVHAVVCSKTLDTADIVRDAIYHHFGSARWPDASSAADFLTGPATSSVFTF